MPGNHSTLNDAITAVLGRFADSQDNSVQPIANVIVGGLSEPHFVARLQGSHFLIVESLHIGIYAGWLKSLLN